MTDCLPAYASVADKVKAQDPAAALIMGEHEAEVAATFAA